MRYFEIVLQTNSEQIKEKAKINLREYAYQNPIAAMNNYMYQHLKNGICFFAYREEGNVTFAAFSYDEKKGVFRDSYDYILDMLNMLFCIKKVKDKFCEITMYQFYENLHEAKRREYFSSWTRIAETANVMLFNYYKNTYAFKKTDDDYGYCKGIRHKKKQATLKFMKVTTLNRLCNFFV